MEAGSLDDTHAISAMFPDIRVELSGADEPALASVSTVSSKSDLLHRAAVSFVSECGSKLRLPQSTIATAIVFVLRFYQQMSWFEYKMHDIATTCLFLAAKSDETRTGSQLASVDGPRRIRDVINIAHKVRNPDAKPLSLDQEYWSIKDKLISHEQLVLRVLQFDVDIVHPYSFLLYYAQTLNIPPKMVQVAWSLVNDSFYSPKCLTFKPHVIAVAAIYLSAELLGEAGVLANAALPSRISGEPRPNAGGSAARINTPPWWTCFDTTHEELEMVSHLLLDFFSEGRPKVGAEGRPTGGTGTGTGAGTAGSSAGIHALNAHMRG
jgi:transcription initiation factor TFIIIB Brf1 subunit/transcription initiation factor TFIIB